MTSESIVLLFKAMEFLIYIVVSDQNQHANEMHHCDEYKLYFSSIGTIFSIVDVSAVARIVRLSNFQLSKFAAFKVLTQCP